MEDWVKIALFVLGFVAVCLAVLAVLGAIGYGIYRCVKCCWNWCFGDKKPAPSLNGSKVRRNDNGFRIAIPSTNKSQISTDRPHASPPRPPSDNSTCYVSLPSYDEDDIPELDLHGYGKKAAKNKLKNFLRKHYNKYTKGNGGSQVKIITGWGKHSKGPPVIKNMTEEYLNNNYARYEWAWHDGEVTVYLSSKY